MKKLAMVLGALLPLALIPAMASAQKIEAGKWTGNVIAPDGDTVQVTYDVALKGDTIGITVTAGEHGSFNFNDVKLVDKALTFWFQPGPRVDCSLARREDGAFAGACKDSEGGTASMVMMPPKKG